MTSRLSASLALVGSMVLFAASYTITKVALVDIGPMTLGAVRFLLATALIAVIVAATRGWQRPTPRDARTLAIGGLLGITAYFALENLGVQWSTATDATLLSAAFPAVIAVTDVLLNKAIIGRRGWWGIGLAMLGSIAIVFGGPIASTDAPKRLWGDLLILLAAVVWALYTFATRDVVTRYSSWTTVLWQDGVGALAFIPLALTEAHTWRRPAHPGPTISAVLTLTVLCSVLAMVLYAMAVRHLSTAVVAASINLVPMFGLVIALLVLNEGVGWLQVLGCAVVIGGVWLTHRQ
ncbi:DMT family transporter [Luteococcus sp. H138]|uniref:DMT family transporter n=1 Tax=unclassified Luteococcus TaxID=2639923 RepID=UPI00313DC474